MSEPDILAQLGELESFVFRIELTWNRLVNALDMATFHQIGDIFGDVVFIGIEYGLLSIAGFDNIGKIHE